MSDVHKFHIGSEDAMVALGRALAAALPTGLLFLSGDLGAGKTTLCRGILRGRGHTGAVKSPTYTLVEPYEFDDGQVFHFDLYRLGDSEELEYMGVRDYFRPGTLCVIEWPDRGDSVLPAPDLAVEITVEAGGRGLVIMASSKAGEQALTRLRSWQDK